MTQQHEVVTRRDQLAVSGPVFREFVGKLVNMEFPIENARAKAKLQFTEMQVIHTIAPYPHPTGELVMNRTSQNGGQPSDRSPWGRLLVSSDEQGYPDIIELLTHILHMLSHEQTIDADPARGREAGSFITWEIVAVDGADNRTPAPASATAGSAAESTNSIAVSTEDDLLVLIHGKTIGEFTTQALGLNLPGPLRASLLDTDGLVPGWINQGKITTDGNIFTRVS